MRNIKVSLFGSFLWIQMTDLMTAEIDGLYRTLRRAGVGDEGGG